MSVPRSVFTSPPVSFRRVLEEKSHPNFTPWSCITHGTGEISRAVRDDTSMKIHIWVRAP